MLRVFKKDLDRLVSEGKASRNSYSINVLTIMFLDGCYPLAAVWSKNAITKLLLFYPTRSELIVIDNKSQELYWIIDYLDLYNINIERKKERSTT